MYAQRGHGKRSSYLFGSDLWRLDGRPRMATNRRRSARPISAPPTRSRRRSTCSSAATPRRSFGPVCHVAHEPDQGPVLEVAFEGLQRSTRHKSGVAMRFPRSTALRWDKPPREADRLETLEKMLKTEVLRLISAARAFSPEGLASFETPASCGLLRMRSCSPHGEERGKAARLEPWSSGFRGH